jgi:hypothetical protein
MDRRKTIVIIPTDLPNPPEQHEVEVAWIVAKHYCQAVEFLRPVDDYKRTTADFIMHGAAWEMKSPEGKSKHNVERQIKRALKQSQNIIFDGQRTATSDDILINRLNYVATQRSAIRKLIYITKDQKVLELVWKK